MKQLYRMHFTDVKIKSTNRSIMMQVAVITRKIAVIILHDSNIIMQVVIDNRQTAKIIMQVVIVIIQVLIVNR